MQYKGQIYVMPHVHGDVIFLWRARPPKNPEGDGRGIKKWRVPT